VMYTPRQTPWILIATAMVLMAVRRVITLAGMGGMWGMPQTISWGAEFTALVISILMVTGMVLLHRALRELAGTMNEQAKVFRESLHTSKNHFQSLASLLHTQAGYAINERQRAFATEIEQKVSAYAILQQQLFEQDYEVDVLRYVEEVSATIEDAYTVPGRQAPIQRDLQSFSVSPKETLYVGLVVSEALINTYKYAGSGAARVEVAVRIGPGEDGHKRVVEVRDTGPGFPEDVLSDERSGFGTTFLRSLNGADWTVTLTNEDGAVVRAIF
jgi:two-component sensor histidine kinase